MNNTEFTIGTLTIMNHEVQVKNCLLPQSELQFYAENPRIYSIIHGSNYSLTQNEIQKALSQQEHVKQLVQSIQANGGLIDPVIVRESDKVVLEGNSRLAAYRILFDNNPRQWGMIKCKVLPGGISEEHVFALLGEYHIIGRKDWAPFEQAGYLWRRFKHHGVAPSKMASDMGLSIKKVNSLINVYDFMVEKNDENVQRWSYYEEYLKSRAIKQAREEHLEMDDVIVQKIKSGEIPRAVDIRDKVSKIASIKGRTLTKFIEQPGSLDSCYESAVSRGVNNQLLKKLKNARELIKDPDTKHELKNMCEEHLDKCKFELDKIFKASKKLLDSL